MKSVAKRMCTVLAAATMALSLGSAVLAADNMSMPAGSSMPGGAAMVPAVSAPATPASMPVVAAQDLNSLGLTSDQLTALNPLIDQAKRVEKTKRDELAKLQADRAKLASDPKADPKKVSNLDKQIQIKQGEITVARGQAQIAFAKVVGDAKAKAVADFVFGTQAPIATGQPVDHNQWLDQMGKTMDQMMQKLPDLAKKDPDQALKTMNEMLKVMNQMTSMMNNDRRGMMAPAANTAAPAPAAVDPNSGSMQMNGGGGSMGMGMMQQEMNMMQQMMQMMPMMDNDKSEMNMGSQPDPNAGMNNMNSDPNAGGMSGGGMGMDGMDKMMGMM